MATIGSECLVPAGVYKEERLDCLSVSDNMGGVSTDNRAERHGTNARIRRRHRRHTREQIRELEDFFKECPHPDTQQRQTLGKQLGMEARQVKFWFQNRRTQMKVQLERQENAILKQENEMLKAENASMRIAIKNPICNSCGNAVPLTELSLEKHRAENMQLKDDLDMACAIAGSFLWTPVQSPMRGSVTNSVASPQASCMALVFGEDQSYMKYASSAIDELVKMAEMEEPLWAPDLAGKLTLNRDEYLRLFSRCGGEKPDGFVVDATKESAVVMMNTTSLLETLMNTTLWSDVFSCIVARTYAIDVVSSAVDRNGALQLMHAELYVPSPLVPIREVTFLRYCKQLEDGAWAIVDVSLDGLDGNLIAGGCRRLPSGCVVRDMPNGHSKITWVEHTEYEEKAVHQLYRPLLRSGMAFGAPRWLAALHRHCEYFAVVSSSSLPTRDSTRIVTANGSRSMLALGSRMTRAFCGGMCAPSARKWRPLFARNVAEDVRVMTRISVDDPGEPSGVVLSAASSIWLPVAPIQLFGFLRDVQLRGEWDILSHGGFLKEMAYIPKGRGSANAVSLLGSSSERGSQSGMLIFQETWTDGAASMVIYAPVDASAMTAVMAGGDSSYVALLPSGFVVMPDGPHLIMDRSGGSADGISKVGGSLLTLGFQILVNSLPTARLTGDSVETVKHLIACTVHRIKAALRLAN